MLFKNTFRLLFSNGHLIWKILLYILIAGLAVAGLSFLVALPIFQLLLNANFFEKISEVYSQFLEHLDLKSLIVKIGDLSVKFVDILNDNLPKVLFSVFGVGFVFLVLGSVVVKLFAMPTSVSLNYYMNSCNKHSFSASFLGSFKKNLAYQFLSLLVFLPVNFGIYYLLLYSFRLFSLGGVFIILSPFIILFGFCLLMSLKHTLLCGWLPSVVVTNKSVFGGLKDGMVVPKRRFAQTFGNAFALELTCVFLNVFGGVFTYGVGLVITIPVSVLLFTIFGMVSYYSATGLKYYLDAYNVMAPKTMEQTDKLLDHKYIV